ncbi:MAG: hypothetical protein K2Q10_00875, partial [Rhodospirillales bacterium]|nr:hypothetical protein [Rhodospirillales bacterium]
MRAVLKASEGAEAARRTVLFALAVAVAILGSLLWNAWDSRRDTLRDAEIRLGGLADLLAEHATRTLEVVDVAIEGHVAALAQDLRYDTRQSRQVHEALLASVERLPQLRSLFAVDEAGGVAAESSSFPALGVTLADRAYFKAQRAHPEMGLLVSGPLKGWRGDQWFLSLSAAFLKPEGGFGGLVIGAVDPGYFQAFYGKTDAFVMKVNPSGNALTYATYLG